ncbi:DUF1178 family protein [Pseudooceanicola onchidii]|uniref:DUF1178 family protein n=1 Tax=Pseudooceanicola onchidii TaxID=2562279 RepID=UPI0010A9A46F|nr:DUF1178 family protein [Pseudooceanicola onchidii]
MIQFSLRCDRDHRFDSWFQSASAFDTLKAQGMVTCAICGSDSVEKAVMAPRVTTGRKKATPDTPRPLSEPASPAEQALRELRKKIEAESDYVGKDFVREARRIHDGEAEARQIHGEARLEDARQLLEDGVPVMPLPFATNRKAN